MPLNTTCPCRVLAIQPPTRRPCPVSFPSTHTHTPLCPLQWIQLQLWERHRLRTLRLTLADIAAGGRLDAASGTLTLPGGQPAAVFYFRWARGWGWEGRGNSEGRKDGAAWHGVALGARNGRKGTILYVQDLRRAGPLEPSVLL